MRKQYRNPDFPIFFYVYENTVLEKKIEALTVQLLVQSPGKFLCMVSCDKNISEIRNITFTFKNCQKPFKKLKTSYGFLKNDKFIWNKNR